MAFTTKALEMCRRIDHSFVNPADMRRCTSVCLNNPYNSDFICINHADQMFFFTNLNHQKCLSYIFPLHLNTCVMGVRPL